MGEDLLDGDRMRKGALVIIVETHCAAMSVLVGGVLQAKYTQTITQSGKRLGGYSRGFDSRREGDLNAAAVDRAAW